MALNNYANLKTSLVNWSKRKDALSLLGDFIALAESKMFANEAEPLQIRELEGRSTSTLSTSERFLALPDDFLSMRKLSLVLSHGNAEMRSTTPEQMNIRVSGQPFYFAVTSQLEFDRVPDSTYTIEMQYYKTLPALSDSNQTNDVLTNYPEIYLHGALWALYIWALQEDKAEYHYNKFLQSIKGANSQSKAGRYGAAPAMRVEGVTP